MKKTCLICIAMLFMASMQAQVPTPTLNFGITSHNEPAEDYTTQANYVKTSDTLRKIVDLIFAKGAKYNMQLNPNFVQGSLIHEQAASTATDVIQYAYNKGGVSANVVEIDPRYKPTALYNIADVSYSIGLTGAQASKNVGGFVYYNATSLPGTYTLGDWIPYTTTITAQNTPTYTWKADIIWGAGSLPPHSNDASNYGVWKPRGKNDSIDFYCHNPSQTVWLQGNGCSWVLTPTTNINSLIAEIRTEATKIRNGTYPSNKFYNGTLMINFKDFGTSTVTPAFQMRTALATVLDSINVMASQGKIAWKTITQKQTTFQAWSTANSITHSQWRCGQTATVTPACVQNGLDELENETYLSVYPNPATDQLTIRTETYFTANEMIITNSLGQICKKIAIKKGETTVTLDVHELPKGVYLIRTGKKVSKFIKE